ncbi:class I SAM-dependent methyltransferase [Jeotgalibacillus sp. ET6]|uniref:class I SAM-dependent methyltransferase n=1 Tax=Jeotgalibacillus sp. ET6 TaxID=3037260 RepID=UPI00241896A7|nr:class I SAM-dependent methyltransferase [Jeotgalibacillus sp. ET6]MDG5473750.1 class I SAM-dependent methyltransferase [Jeotgalibacillus sp. ET6]
MSDHYYSKTPGTESNPLWWDFTLRGHTLRFKTDQGVFSKKEVDFGSRFLIETFSEPEIKGPLLDVGCGYGPIGLTLAKSTNDREIHLVDVNNRALDLARENAVRNDASFVKVYESDCLDQVTTRDFAAILTNPPIRAGKKVVHRIFEQSAERLAPGGELWVVIQKKQGAPSAKDKLETLFGNVEVAAKSKGYFILRAKKSLTL